MKQLQNKHNKFYRFKIVSQKCQNLGFSPPAVFAHGGAAAMPGLPPREHLL